MSGNSKPHRNLSDNTGQDRQQTSDKNELMRVFIVVGNLGLVMIFSIITGFFAGFWLDKFFGKKYIFLMAGIVIGIAAGFYRCYLIIKKELKL